MSHPGLVIFGEVLFDRFPDGSRVLGGAPFNVAWHCQAFGLEPLFISRVGNDPLGREVRSAMMAWDMDTSGLQMDSSHGTGVVDVSFEDGEPHYNIVENSAWDFIDNRATPVIDGQCIFYHGSLVNRSTVSGGCLGDLRKQHSGSVLVDLNLREPWWNRGAIEEMIHGCRWIKLNADELSIMVPQEHDTESRARYLLSASQAEMVVVTRGARGAIAITEDATFAVIPESADSVADTVGAGDAFCSVLLLGLKKHWSINDILERAQQFASVIVQQHGATSSNKDMYRPLIRDWNL